MCGVNSACDGVWWPVQRCTVGAMLFLYRDLNNCIIFTLFSSSKSRRTLCGTERNTYSHGISSVFRLRETFQASEHGMIPRQVIFRHYVQVCQKNNIEPVISATLGKMIRSVFPNVKTRRLGTRRLSKYVNNNNILMMIIHYNSTFQYSLMIRYHYCGICYQISTTNTEMDLDKSSASETL